jgi:hypothetical protein
LNVLILGSFADYLHNVVALAIAFKVVADELQGIEKGVDSS